MQKIRVRTLNCVPVVLGRLRDDFVGLPKDNKKANEPRKNLNMSIQGPYATLCVSNSNIFPITILEIFAVELCMTLTLQTGQGQFKYANRKAICDLRWQ